MKQSPSLTVQVMDHVREAVIDGRMPPGSWHSVYQLSDQLGISRSPVRDALLRLEEAGLVEFARNRGFRIVETTANDVAEIFAIRLGIEPVAAFRAALDRTDEQVAEADSLVAKMGHCANEQNEEGFFTHDRALHRLIMTTGATLRGADLVDRLRVHTRILGASTAGTSRSFQDIIDEHQPIVEAVRRGSAEIARASMREHLTITGKLLLRQSMPDLPGDEVERMWDHYTRGV
ncbi:MAG: GntR family transcriptional regulator [Mycobacteriaceae bacterium]|uniref:GntR family transcriptional regulator n=1 Tax=Corynebacterium sp. TaxID=1720 RepID=UPI003F9DEE44